MMRKGQHEHRGDHLARDIEEKLLNKHGVSREDVEQIFESNPRFHLAEKGHVHGENLYRAIGQTESGRFLMVIFISKLDRSALVISARDLTAKENNMPRSNKKRDPVPHEFATLEQAAKFWDTHDLTDYEDIWHQVDFKVDLKRRPGLQVVLDPQIASEFAKRARAKKTRLDKLVNRVLKDYLSRAA